MSTAQPSLRCFSPDATTSRWSSRASRSSCARESTCGSMTSSRCASSCGPARARWANVWSAAHRHRRTVAGTPIVGVVRDMRREGLDVAPILSGFVPSFLRGMDLTIRASNEVNHLIPAVRQEISAIDRLLPITHVATADSRLSERLDGRRFETQVLGVFAAIALLLSAAGLYALLAYQVALRTREIGIRSALGADRHSIVAMILGRGIRLALAGTALGALGAGRLRPAAAEPAVRNRRPRRAQLRRGRGLRAAGRCGRCPGARATRRQREPDDRFA